MRKLLIVTTIIFCFIFIFVINSDSIVVSIGSFPVVNNNGENTVIFQPSSELLIANSSIPPFGENKILPPSPLDEHPSVKEEKDITKPLGERLVVDGEPLPKKDIHRTKTFFGMKMGILTNGYYSSSRQIYTFLLLFVIIILLFLLKTKKKVIVVEKPHKHSKHKKHESVAQSEEA